MTTVPFLSNKGKPRAARRARKPMQENWHKAPRGRWLKCTYEKCSHVWLYFGGRSWAECPNCHSTMKVAIAQRNYRSS